MKLSLFSHAVAFALAAALLAAPTRASAAEKTYQVTGPVTEVTDSTVTVQKGKEKWQMARDKDAKITGDLKVGSKVTIEYTMTAKTVEVKGQMKPEKDQNTDPNPRGTKTEK
jgi:hypothetical protein